MTACHRISLHVVDSQYVSRDFQNRPRGEFVQWSHRRDSVWARSNPRPEENGEREDWRVF
jgi:hypothetical protein